MLAIIRRWGIQDSSRSQGYILVLFEQITFTTSRGVQVIYIKVAIKRCNEYSWLLLYHAYRANVLQSAKRQFACCKAVLLLCVTRDVFQGFWDTFDKLAYISCLIWVLLLWPAGERSSIILGRLLQNQKGLNISRETQVSWEHSHPHETWLSDDYHE